MILLRQNGGNKDKRKQRIIDLVTLSDCISEHNLEEMTKKKEKKIENYKGPDDTESHDRPNFEETLHIKN